MKRVEMREGFTILELIVVISVLLILIGIAIPRIKGMQDSGNITKAKAELQTLQSAMESYYSNITPHEYVPTTSAPVGSYFSGQTPQIVSGGLYDPFNSTSPTTEYHLVTNAPYYAFFSVGPAQTGSVTSVNNGGNGTTTGTGSPICITNAASVTGCS